MILFYSEYCPHCRMLKETISNYDKTNQIVKLVCIDILRKKGQTVPSQIKSVPALIKMPNKEIIFGKDVFDYLLLPGSGLLLKQKETSDKKEVDKKEINNNLLSFAFIGNSKYSSFYAEIEDGSDNVQQENSNSWSTIMETSDQLNGGAGGAEGAGGAGGTEGELGVDPASFLPINEKTRNEKEEFDFEKFKMQRDLDIRQKDLNTLELSPPIKTRDQ